MGGPALCVVIGLVALLDLGFLSVLVLPTQGWLLFRRLRKSRQWLTSKTAIFYGIVFENIAMLLHCLMWRHITPVLHLVFDYSQFLLFTCVFYYFTLHTFQIMGRIVAIRATVYFLTVANVLYLSGFTLYISIEMVADEVQSYCKTLVWLSMRCSACALSLLLIGVGLFASHYLNRRSGTVSKRRVKKLWAVIVTILVSTFLQLAYDSYETVVHPNYYCLGLLSVILTQSQYKVTNAATWLLDRLLCNFSVDGVCVYAFWPVRKSIIPLLKPDDIAIHSILNTAVLSSTGTASGDSLEEEMSDCS